MAIPPRPEPSFEEDYDDGDPYACMAAGAAGIPSKMDAYKAKILACYGQPQEKLDRFVTEDKASALAGLWEVWYQHRFLEPLSDQGPGNWAAEQSARLGNPSLVEYDRKRR